MITSDDRPPIDRRIKKERDHLDHIDFGAKAGTGVAALAYISGYLTQTFYLGHFRIHTDASEFFRAKYLYIGFEYWFFIVILVVLLILLHRGLEWFRERSTDKPGQPTFTQKEILKANALLIQMKPGTLVSFPAGGDSGSDNSPSLIPAEVTAQKRGDHLSEASRHFLRAIVITMLMLVLASEVLFADPEDIDRYLPMEIVFFFHMLFFQTVRYACLLPYRPVAGGVIYVWGLLYGKKIVEFLARFSAVGIFASALVLVTHKFPWLKEFRNDHWLGYGCLAALFIAFDLFALWLLLLGYEKFQEIDDSKIWGDWGPRNYKGFITLLKLSSKIKGTRRLRVAMSWCFSTILLGCAYEAFEFTEVQKDRWHVLIYKVCLTLCRLILPFLILLVSANFWILADKTIFRNRHLESVFKQYGFPPLDKERTRFIVWQNWILRASPATALYVVSIFAFARIVYPQIPDSKAGGKINDPPAWVQVTTLGQTRFGSCPTIPPDSYGYAILEEDSNWVYLARAEDIRRVPDTAAPQVYELNRNCVGLMITAGRRSPDN